MRFGFLFGAGAEVGYGLPSGGMFALDIFRCDTTHSKQIFKEMRDKVDSTTAYAAEWLPDDYRGKNISSFGKSVFQHIIKDTVEHNRSSIVNKLNDFDSIASVEAERMLKSDGININDVIEKVLGRPLDNIRMGQDVAFIDEFKNGNELFNNTYFAAFLLLYKKKLFLQGEQRVEFRKILLSVLQLQVGALSEELTRKINDSLFAKKDDEIDLLDDLGEIIQLNYSSSGLLGMEYLLELQMADTTTESGQVLRFAQRIIESIYSSVLDYKSLIDSNWYYLYNPKYEWAKFSKICIFLLTVREYISDKANKVNITLKSNGYYNMLRDALDNNEYEVSVVATTNYNQFISTILKLDISYLNGSTEMWYDPFINRIGTKTDLDNDEHHILVPLMFTQSGTKPMTSISMSEQYVNTYHEWKGSDAVVVVGFGFGVDDEHINGIIRTLIDVDNKKLIVVTLNHGKDTDTEAREIGKKLKISKKSKISVVLVNKDGIDIQSGKKWTEVIKMMI